MATTTASGGGRHRTVLRGCAVVSMKRFSTSARIVPAQREGAASAHPTSRSTGRPTTRRRAALVLSVVALAAMLASSILGLVVGGLYGDPASTAEMLRGYDLVTLAVAVPLLGLAMLRMRTGSPRASLVWVSVLAYGVYNYAIYLFGTGFNDAFLLHVVAFSASLFALVLGLSTLDTYDFGRRFSPRTPVRWIAGLLALLAVGLGAMWIFYAVRFVVSGEAPVGSTLVETDTITHLGYVLDLSLLVPAYALAAVLLWRRAPWGYVLAALVLVSGALHQLGYLVALVFQANSGVPGATAFDPLEVPIAAIFLLGAVALLAGLRGDDRQRREMGRSLEARKAQ